MHFMHLRNELREVRDDSDGSCELSNSLSCCVWCGLYAISYVLHDAFMVLIVPCHNGAQDATLRSAECRLSAWTQHLMRTKTQTQEG